MNQKENRERIGKEIVNSWERNMRRINKLIQSKSTEEMSGWIPSWDEESMK